MPRRHCPTVHALLAALSLAALAACGGHVGAAQSTAARTRGVSSAEAAGGSLPQVAPQLIRTGRMYVEVYRLEPARARLERSLTALGGRVAFLQTNEDERADYTLRVPAERLDALMDSVAMLGEVETRAVSATDVTEQVVDAEARLSALRASRDRLRQLLDRANSVQDVVTVERELARVQGELESLERRLNTLRGQVALSELSVTLRRRPVLGPLGLLIQGVATLLGKLFVIQ